MRRTRLALLVAVLAATTACSTSNTTSSSSSAASVPAQTELTVFAASSLITAFTQIGADFEAANPGTRVVFNFASSTDLAAQITSEGTAGVFASASGTAMDAVAADPGVINRVNFATNRLVIITPPDNPAHVASIGSLTDPLVQVVIAAEGVPVGDYTRDMLRNEGIDNAVLSNVVSNEPDDASVVARIVNGDGDAGIVYTSDLATVGDAVLGIDIPAAVNVTATYPIAVVTSSEQESMATSFVAWVTGPNGQAVLRVDGFGPPDAT
jgi:molybdate transport system substrate-binding protein